MKASASSSLTRVNVKRLRQIVFPLLSLATLLDDGEKVLFSLNERLVALTMCAWHFFSLASRD
jgi:hypothetical protein